MVSINESINLALSSAVASQLLITAISCRRIFTKSSAAKIFPFFSWALCSYLFAGFTLNHGSTWAFLILLVGGAAVPFFSWLLVESIFDDHWKFNPIYIPIFLMVEIVAFVSIGVELLGWFGLGDQTSSYLIWPHRILSIIFSIAIVRTIFRGWKDDLVESRRKFRIAILSVLSFMIFLVSAIEIYIGYNPSGFNVILDTINFGFIFILVLLFNYRFLETSGDIFFSERREVARSPSLKENHTHLRNLADQVQAYMTREKAYRLEGLSVGLFAEKIGAQEYLLRQAINGELGFRNFSDFLNSYRINEASHLLIDQPDEKILSIALEVGYRSLTPFNKAFRAAHNMTPSEYRKKRGKQ